MFKRLLKILGGAGSGNFGHSGRPGQRGGSSKGEFHVVPPEAVHKYDPKGTYPLYHVAPAVYLEDILKHGVGVPVRERKTIGPWPTLGLDPNKGSSWTRDPHYSIQGDRDAIRITVSDKSTLPETEGVVATVGRDSTGDDLTAAEYEQEEYVKGPVTPDKITAIHIGQDVHNDLKERVALFTKYAAEYDEKARTGTGKVRGFNYTRGAQKYREDAAAIQRILDDPRLHVGWTVREGLIETREHKKEPWKWTGFKDLCYHALGSAASGNFGHVGRPGQRGGSAKRDSAAVTTTSTSTEEVVSPAAEYADVGVARKALSRGNTSRVFRYFEEVSRDKKEKLVSIKEKLEALETKNYDARYALLEERRAIENELRSVFHAALFDGERDSHSPRLVSKYGSTARLKGEEKEALTWLSNVITPEAINKPAIISRKEASASSYWGGEITLAYGSDAGTLVHEMGHHVDDWTDPEVRQMARAFFEERTKGLEAEPRGEGSGRYYVVPDNFMNEYTGRLYGREGARLGKEVISMGLEHLYRNPVRFYEKDPEHFKLMLKVISFSRRYKPDQEEQGA